MFTRVVSVSVPGPRARDTYPTDTEQTLLQDAYAKRPQEDTNYLH